MKKRPVYLHEIQHLADRIGEQIEALADRDPDHRHVVTDLVMVWLSKRYGGQSQAQQAMFLASLGDRSRPLDGAEKQPQP